MQIPNGAIQFPSGWNTMNTADRLNWIKNLSKPTPEKAAEQSKWLKSMQSRFSEKNLVPPTAHEDLLRNVAKASTPSLASLRTVLGATVSPLLSILAPIAAGAAAAGAILGTKRKFDRGINNYTTDTINRSNELIKAIRAQRDRKKKKEIVGGGASPLLKKTSVNLSQGKNYIGEGASDLLRKSSIDLSNGKNYIGGGASPLLRKTSINLSQGINK